AANICDANYSNKFNEAFPYYPSVFRPRFELRGNEVFIVDYDEVVDAAAQDSPVHNSNLWVSLDDSRSRSQLASGGNISVYGIPIIIGARKGLPNFNELVVQTAVDFTRKLEFEKRSVTDLLPFK